VTLPARRGEHRLTATRRGIRREVQIERRRVLAGGDGGADRRGIRGREHALLERGDLTELVRIRIGIDRAVGAQRAERLVLEGRSAAIELVRAGVRDVLHRRHAAPHPDRPIGVGDHVARPVDHVEVVGQAQRHADQTGAQVREGRHRRRRIVGVDPVEQHVTWIRRGDVRRSEREVVSGDVAGRARASVGVREGVVEEVLTAGDLALGHGGVGADRACGEPGQDQGAQGLRHGKAETRALWV